MLRFPFAKSFRQSLKRFPAVKKIEIQRRVDAFMLAMDARELPPGLGLKKLTPDVCEFRIGLDVRALFQWQRNEVTFLFVGNHNEAQRFLKHFT